MTTRNQEILSMWEVVEKLLDANEAIWNTQIGFSKGVALFKTQKALTPNIIKSQQNNTSDVTLQRNTLRTDAITAAVNLAGSLESYAIHSNNAILESESNYTESKLKQAKVNDLPAILKIIYDKGNDNLAGLADYGISAGSLTIYKNKIDAYKTAIGTPQVAIGQHKSATTALNNVLATGQKSLTSLDNLLYLFNDTNPAFITEFESARTIIKRRGRAAKKKNVANEKGKDGEVK